jgi:hypothetical protein
VNVEVVSVSPPEKVSSSELVTATFRVHQVVPDRVLEAAHSTMNKTIPDPEDAEVMAGFILELQ